MSSELTMEQQLRFRIIALEGLVHTLLEQSGVDEITIKKWRDVTSEVKFDESQILNGVNAIQKSLKK